jgi:hypothetical protein
MRLPSSTSVLQLERLDVADYGTLLIPATISQVTVDELHLGRDARIAIVPGNTALQLQVRHAQLEQGSQITSRGAPGTHEKPAKAGRDLTLRINSLTAGWMAPMAWILGAPGARRGAVSMAITAAMACRVERVHRCAWSCRRTSRRNTSRSGWMAGLAVWPARPASRAKAGSPKVAWCTAPRVARRAGQGWKGSRGQLGLRVP